MATSSQALAIEISADTAGAQAGVLALAQRIEQLAADLEGPLQVQARAAAAQLRTLAEQGEAAAQLQGLQERARRTAEMLGTLRAQAASYAASIAASGPPTAEQAAHLQALQRAAQQASANLATQNAAIAQAQARLSALGSSASSAAAAQARVASSVDAIVAGAGRLSPQLSQLAARWAAAGGAATQAAGSSEGAGSRMAAAIDAARGAASRLVSAFKSAASSAANFFGLDFSVKGLVQTSANLHALKAGLQAVGGSAEAASEQLQWVARIANSAGVDTVDAARAWMGLAASVQGTAVEGKAARDVFEAVTNAMAAAGKSSAETANALLALSQMASKGVVMAQELRGQLGNALPGALQSAAKGMGVTVAELNKMVELGKVTAEQMFPALTKGLNELYDTSGQSKTLATALQQVKNAFGDMVAAIGEAGANNSLIVFADTAATALIGLGDLILTTGQKIGATFALIATRDLGAFKEALAEIEQESAARIAGYAQHNAVLRAAVESMGSAAQQAALAAREQAAATQEAGAAASSAAGSAAQLAAEQKKAAAAASEAVQAAKDEVQLAAQRTKTLQAEAKAAAGSAEEKRAAAQAAAEEAAAQQRLVAAYDAQLAAARAAVAQKEESLRAIGAETDAQAKELAALRASAEALELQTLKAREAAAAAQRLAQETDSAAGANARLESALKTLGVNAASVWGGISSGARSALEAVRQVTAAVQESGETGRRVGETIVAALSAAIPKMDSAEALDALRAQLQQAAAAGKITATQMTALTAALEQQRQALQGAGQGAGEMAGALDTLGQAADTATHSLTQLAGSSSSGWSAAAAGARDAAEAAEEATAATGRAARTHTVYWLGATAAASQYRDEAIRYAEEIEGAFQSMQGRNFTTHGYIAAYNHHFALMRQLTDEYAAAMQRLDAQAAQLQERQSGAAAGVDSMRLRLLELKGTEEEIAQARAAQETAQLQREIALAEIELQRASLRGDNGEYAARQKEIAALKEQLDLLAQIHKEEKRQRDEAAKEAARQEKAEKAEAARKEREAKQAAAAGSEGSSSGTAAPSKQSTINLGGVTINAGGVSDPAKLARLLEPELKKLQRLAA